MFNPAVIIYEVQHIKQICKNTIKFICPKQNNQLSYIYSSTNKFSSL